MIKSHRLEPYNVEDPSEYICRACGQMEWELSESCAALTPLKTTPKSRARRSISMSDNLALSDIATESTGRSRLRLITYFPR